ncbi:hypothetical protein [Bacillus cytotoxicus]|nr:hypothetical protein [Bacillus cytotoxicus]
MGNRRNYSKSKAQTIRKSDETGRKASKDRSCFILHLKKLA